MQTISLENINNSRKGFHILVKFCADTSSASVVEVDMQNTSWIDADMCAPFGAIIDDLRERQVEVRLVKLQDKVRDILSRNGFLQCYGGDRVHDAWGTSVAYKRFSIDNEVAFSNYVSTELLVHDSLPKMSAQLRKVFSQNISEIFSNAVHHSKTLLGVFSCGQYFPKKGRLVFTIADLGIGMRQNINENRGLDFSSVEAINWATKGNSTKSTGNPGGLGLKFLCHFLERNEGCVRIVSDRGYWKRSNSGEITTEELPHPFPGTVVSLELNTEDKKSYVLSSELDVDNPF